MKKIKRLIITFLALCMLLTMTSCGYLDELRAKQGYFTKEDSFDSITFGGNEYLLYDETYTYQIPSTETINVTQQEVPVLLSDFTGNKYYINDEKTVISIEEAYGKYCYYVKKDYYDTFDSIVKNTEFTHYCYYSGRSEEPKLIGIDKEISDAISNALKTQGINMKDNYALEYYTDIYSCDEGMNLINYVGIICKDENGYYIESYSDTLCYKIETQEELLMLQ